MQAFINIKKLICKKCKLEKDIINFYPRQDTKFGYTVCCKQCIINRRKEIKNIKQGGGTIKDKREFKDNQLKCKICNEFKELNCFYLNKKSVPSSPKCKICFLNFRKLECKRNSKKRNELKNKENQ